MDLNKLGVLTQDEFELSKIAIKKDDNKSRVDLIDADWLIGIGNVLKHGAIKYSDNNWRNGFKFRDRKSTRLNSSHIQKSRMPSSA